VRLITGITLAIIAVMDGAGGRLNTRFISINISLR
jgi:Flp pilus assembly pilin Flp